MLIFILNCKNIDKYKNDQTKVVLLYGFDFGMTICFMSANRLNLGICGSNLDTKPSPEKVMMITIQHNKICYDPNPEKSYENRCRAVRRFITCRLKFRITQAFQITQYSLCISFLPTIQCAI